MKILLFADGLRAGGKERRIVELVKYLSQLEGLEITLVLLNADIHYKIVNDLNLQIELIASRNIVKRFVEFYRIIKSIRPDIIHTWDNISSILTIPIKILTRIKWINGQINTAPHRLLDYGFKVYLGSKASMFFADKIVANSYAGLQSFRAPKNKRIVIYNGFDFNRIADLDNPETIKAKFNLNGRYIVGMVASFSTVKDYPTFIAAAQLLLKNRSDISFICVGNGDRNSVENLISQENRDSFAFFDAQQNIESLINIFDVGVLATFTEGVSNVILEMMALSKPVVATAGGGTIEIITDNETGFLVPPRNAKILAERISVLLDNSEQRRAFGENGKLKVHRMFDIQNMKTLYEKLYRSLNSEN